MSQKARPHSIAASWSNHGTKVLLKVKKGKLKGKEILHFKCSYCRDKHFQGPSSTAFLDHLRKVHPQKCPELLPNVKKQPKDFFSKAKKMGQFNEDVFMGKLLKWIIRSKMLLHLEEYFKMKYPKSGFSVQWNQVECLAHVLNLWAQEILGTFKQPIDEDEYEPGNDSADSMVSAVSRLAFLVRKIRASPKMRRLMEKICAEQT